MISISRNPLLWSALSFLAITLLIAGCTAERPAAPVTPPGEDASNQQSATQDTPAKPRVVRISKMDNPEEPKPDPSQPIGVPSPAFIGEVSPDAVVVDRTGTYGGRFVYAILGEVETFNPVEPKGATDQEIRALVFSSLVTYNNGKWQTEPALAKSWEVSDDQLTWTFFIRDGIRWSDGEEMNVEDALFSFQAVFHPQIATSIKDGFKHPETGELPEVMADKERNALVFKLKRIDSQFLTHVGNVSIIPEHKWRDHLQEKDPTLLQQMTSNADPADLVGCGPFVLKQYVPAEKIVYQRNPHYWKVDSRQQRLPYLDEVVIVLVKDSNLMWQKFEAGELDIFEDVPADHFREAVAMEKEAKASLIRLGVSLNSNWVCFNLHPGKNPDTGEPFVDEAKAYWFNNLQFRKAVNHAIDRDGIKRTAFQGRATAIWSSITPGNKSWYHAGVPKYPFDLDKAKKILDDLGWTDRDGDGVREDDKGRKISFSLNTNVENNLRQQVGNLISKDLVNLGLEINFKPIVFNDLVTSLRDSHKWDMILLGWGSGVPPDPANGKNITLSSGRLHAWYPQQPEPATEWEARIDNLMAMMDEELDDKVRKKYYDEVQELIGQNIPILYLIAANSYAASQEGRIGNLWPSLLRPQMTWNLESLWKAQPEGEEKDLLTFSLRRLLSIPPLVLVVSFLTFLLLKQAPGDFYSQMEADPTRSTTEVLRQKENAGLLVRLDRNQLVAIGEFSDDGHRWSFADEGGDRPVIRKDGSPVHAKEASRSLLKFQIDGTQYQCDDEAVVYRKVGAIEGFFSWLFNALTLDFGTSYKFNRPVFGIIAERLLNTLTLSLAALVIAYGLGVPLGIFAAVKPNSRLDHSAGIIAFLGLSIPTVFFALLAMLFASYTGWFPIGDMRSLDYDQYGFFGKIANRIHHLFLPALVLGTSAMAGYMRQARGNMIEALGQDYVRTARAKGVSEQGVLFKHAFRNAVNPLVTLFGYSLASLLSGSLLVEIVMNWPGLGRLIFEAISAKDEPLVLASVLISTLLLVFGNLAADILLAVVDPRVRLS